MTRPVLGPAPGPQAQTWLDRPVGLAPSLALIALLLLMPAWLFWDQLRYFRLNLDDFSYLIDCRSGAEPLSNLWKPHQTHVVPLFRLITAAAARLTSNPGQLLQALGLANYLGLVLLMLSLGLLVARESHRLSTGLMAMVLVGLSSVIGSATTWYSAGQTTWAALAVVVTLLLLQSWRLHPHPLPLLGALAAAGAAPLLWTGGLVAGPAGSAYLWTAGRRRSALLLLLPSLAAVSLILLIAANSINSAKKQGDAPGSFSPTLGVLYTFQALPESLVLASLGLDAEASAVQGLILSGALALVWAFNRRGVKLSPLEAAGAASAALAYVMVFTFRSKYRFDDLRAEDWYDTIPLAGAVLFVTAWWSWPVSATAPARPARLRRREALAILALAVAALLVNQPRAQRLLLQKTPPLLPSEQQRLPIPSLQRLRALYIAEGEADRQRRALVRLGQAASTARRLGISRSAIRAVFGRIEVPNWPDPITDRDALDLLDFPNSGPEHNASRIRSALAPLLTPEPVERPPWIMPDEPWPPPSRFQLPDPQPRASSSPNPSQPRSR